MPDRVSTLFLVFFGLFCVAAWSNAKHYQRKGQLLAVDGNKVKILVNQEDIPGLMPAMTMPYKVESVTMLDNIGPGDLISADLAVENGTAVVTKITKTGTAKVDTPAPSPIASGFELIKVGAEIPNQVLIDQDGKERH